MAESFIRGARDIISKLSPRRKIEHISDQPKIPETKVDPEKLEFYMGLL